MNDGFMPVNPDVIGEATFSDALEFSVLGTVMLAPESYPEVSHLKEAHFQRPAHKTLWRTVRSMIEAGTPIDFVTLRDELGSERVSECGGIDYLIQLAESVPDPNNVGEYAKRMVDRWAIRRYAQIGEKAKAGASFDELRIMAASVVELAVVPSLGNCVGRLGTFGSGQRRRGITMGYGEELDSYFSSRGYPEGQTTVVSAYHKSGKSAWMLGSAIAQAKLGYSVLYATFADMSGTDLEERAMKNETGWGFCPDALYLQTDWLDVKRMIGEDLHIDVYDPGELDTGYDIETFEVWLRHRMAKVRYDCVFVDYAQELSSCKVPTGDEYPTARMCASVLQRMARKLRVPIVVGSQITEGRNGERDKTKGSRVWEEKAGVVLRIKREQTGDGAQIDIPYSRFGLSGTVFLRWDQERVRFERRAV